MRAQTADCFLEDDLETCSCTEGVKKAENTIGPDVEGLDP